MASSADRSDSLFSLGEPCAWLAATITKKDRAARAGSLMASMTPYRLVSMSSSMKKTNKNP